MLFWTRWSERSWNLLKKIKTWEEINESVEIEKERDQFLLELARENYEKDVVLDEVIWANSTDP